MPGRLRRTIARYSAVGGGASGSGGRGAGGGVAGGIDDAGVGHEQNDEVLTGEVVA